MEEIFHAELPYALPVYSVFSLSCWKREGNGHSLSTYHTAGVLLSALYTLSLLILTVTLWGRQFYPHFIAQETQAQGGSVTCPGSPNHWMDYDLGSNCKAPGPSTKHATSHLENVLQDIFYFHSAILALFIYFHFELYKSSVRVLFGESHILKIYSKALLSLGRQFSFLMENFRSYCHYENTLWSNFKLLLITTSISEKFNKKIIQQQMVRSSPLFSFSGYLFLQNKLL